MDGETSQRSRRLMLAAGVFLTVWAIWGFIDGVNEGYTDALFEPDYTIGRAPEGGVLREAGFQAGDSVVAVEGIPVVELGMYSRWPRSLDRAPGESLTLTVERQGELVDGEVMFRKVPSGTVKMRAGGTIIVFAFLWAGMWALLVVRTAHARRLALLGLVLAVGIPGPDAGTWNGVMGHIQAAALALWTLLLLRFFLFFPAPTRMGESRVTTAVLYAAWVGLLICFGLELVYHPRLYHSFGGYTYLLMLAYALLAFGAVAHTVITTPRPELRESGMSLIFWGVLVAVVGTLIGFVDWALLGSIQIPGSNWLPLTIAAVPTASALAVKKHALREAWPGAAGGAP